MVAKSAKTAEKKKDVANTADNIASTLPYIVQPTIITKVLSKIKEARAPDRFTYDFLETKLNCRGGNYRQFLSLAKKLGLLNSDGTPSDLYHSLRNSQTAGAAMAQAIRRGYRELFDRNEYTNSLTRDALKGLVVQVTGLEQSSRVVQLIGQTFETLKGHADFEAAVTNHRDDRNEEEPHEQKHPDTGRMPKLGLAYNINLVLPKTDDPAVFTAIFRSLREQLLH